MWYILKDFHPCGSNWPTYQPQVVIWDDSKVDNIMSQKDLLKN
jgi:hypothetical protein